MVIGDTIAISRNNRLLFAASLPRCDDIEIVSIKGRQYVMTYTACAERKFNILPRIRLNMFRERPPRSIKKIGPFEQSDVIVKCDDTTFCKLERGCVYYYSRLAESLFDGDGCEVERFDISDNDTTESCLDSFELLPCGFPVIPLLSARVQNSAIIIPGVGTYYFHKSNEEKIDLTITGEFTFEDHFITLNPRFVYLKNFRSSGWDYMLTKNIEEAIL